MINTLKKYFPQSRKKWKVYFKIFLPSFLSSFIFVLNSIIDNLMVGHISGGQEALSIASSWTEILIGIFLGISSAGSVVLAQFYHNKNYKMAIYFSKIRYLLSLFFAIIFLSLVYVIPNNVISFFIRYPKTPSSVLQYENIVNLSKMYLKIIAFSWILTAVSHNLIVQLNEIGHVKASLIFTSISIVVNIVFNSIFLFVLNLGIKGASYATIMSVGILIIAGIIYMFKKRIPILFNPFFIFVISKKAIILFLKRIFYSLAMIILFFLITSRNKFYDIAYPTGSLGTGIGALGVIALVKVFSAIFLVFFDVLNNLTANFVTSELGKGNIDNAKKNSDELKGFNFSVSFILSILLVSMAAVVPEMHFLSTASNIDNAKKLKEVSYALMVTAFYFPTWILIATSNRNGNAGGKGYWFSLISIIFSSLQIGWLAALTYVIVPKYTIFDKSFTFFYFCFFLSDFFLFALYEIIYHKTKWAYSLTKNIKEDENKNTYHHKNK